MPTVLTPTSEEVQSHQEIIKSSMPHAVGRLVDILGARLVAYLCGVKQTRTVHEWVKCEHLPSQIVQTRILNTLQIVNLIEAKEGASVTQAWFQGMNPYLNDIAPIRLLREGDPEEISPEVMRAGKTFITLG